MFRFIPGIAEVTSDIKAELEVYTYLAITTSRNRHRLVISVGYVALY
jgi:hypothetical protein